MPAPLSAAAAAIAPIAPSVTEYHMDQQPRLFLLPKVTSTYYQKPSLFCYLRKNVLKQGKNIFVKFEGPDRGDVYRKVTKYGKVNENNVRLDFSVHIKSARGGDS